MISFTSEHMKFHPVISVNEASNLYLPKHMDLSDFNKPFHLTLQIKRPLEVCIFSLQDTAESTFWVK